MKGRDRLHLPPRFSTQDRAKELVALPTGGEIPGRLEALRREIRSTGIKAKTTYSAMFMAHEGFGRMPDQFQYAGKISDVLQKMDDDHSEFTVSKFEVVPSTEDKFRTAKGDDDRVVAGKRSKEEKGGKKAQRGVKRQKRQDAQQDTKRGKAAAAQARDRPRERKSQEQLEREQYYREVRRSEPHRRRVSQALRRAIEVLSNRETAATPGNPPIPQNPFRIELTRDSCEQMGLLDYLQVVIQPMDLIVIKRKVDTHQYQTVRDFERDFYLMLANAKQYYAGKGTGDWILRFGEVLREEYDRNLKVLEVDPELTRLPPKPLADAGT